MMKMTFPVIFTETDNCILIEVPDLGVLSEGKSIDNAIDMARDAISLNIISREDNSETIPSPSKVSDINIQHIPH